MYVEKLSTDYGPRFKNSDIEFFWLKAVTETSMNSNKKLAKIKRLYRRRKKMYGDVLRTQLTTYEAGFLRKLALANICPFDFQVAIGPYFVDFVLPTKMVVIELDGSQHGLPAAQDYDQKRTEFLMRHGFTVLRIPNKDSASYSLDRFKEWPDRKGYASAITASKKKQFIYAIKAA